MRGEPIEIPVPVGGLRTDAPPHKIPANCLVAGANCYVGHDGLLHPRFGYTPLQGAPNVIKGRVNGGFSFQDQAGNFQYVVNTNTDWWTLNASGMTWQSCPFTWTTMPYTWTNIPQNYGWTQITNTAYGLNGSSTNPGQFAVMFQGGLAWLIGVDNFSPPVRWNSTLSAFTTVTLSPNTVVTISESGTTATAILAQPVTNIVVGDSITIAGNSIAAYNGTFTVTAVPTPTQVSYTTTSGHLVGTGGTLVDNSIIQMPPARDITILTNRVVIVSTLEQGTRYIHRVRWSAAGDMTRWPILAYTDILDSEDDPTVGIQTLGQNTAACYGEESIFLLVAQAGDDANAFTTERIQTADFYTGPASPACLSARAEGVQYYQTINGQIQSFDGVNVNTISSPIDQLLISSFDTANASKCHASHIVDSRQLLFFYPTRSLTKITGDPSVAAVYDLERQIWLPPYEFSEGITASFEGQVQDGDTWTNDPYTWLSNPYTWDNAPVGQETDTMTATAKGEVDTFFRGTFDGANLYVVPWNATWSYLWDPKNVIKFEQAEFYFVPVANAVNQPGGIEVVTMQFTSLTHPYDKGTNLIGFACQMSDGWTNQTVLPGATNPANVRNNLISMQLQSSESKGGAGFAGGILFGFRDPRGQYGNG